MSHLCSLLPSRRLVDAMAASAVVEAGGAGGDGDEWLVLDHIGAFDGLERLVVICVGLDTPRTDAADALGASRSQLYRAITRAHMMVLVVNELVRGGWLEFFPRVLEFYPRTI